MREKCDLERMREEIREDEKLDQSDDRKLSQEAIGKMVAERRKRKKGETDARNA
jgi:hypothetical protein